MPLLWYRQINITQMNNIGWKKFGVVENKIPDISGLLITAVLNTKIGKVENKIPNVSGLVTNAVLDTKTSEVENTIPDVSDFAKKRHYEAKKKGIKGKYFTTADYHKFTSDIIDAKIKQK